MRTVLIIGVSAVLAACGSSPTEPPPPPPEINVVMCATPAAMTGKETEPSRPRGDYTQANVALYSTDLHQWGTRGWLKLARVREHAEKCANSAEYDEEND